MKTSVFYLASFVAGMLQVQSPDQWVPLSVWSWQRGRRGIRMVLVAVLFYICEILSGWLLYRSVRPFLTQMDVHSSINFVAVVLISVGVFRFFRFEGIVKLLRLRSAGPRAMIQVALMMVTAEFLIPLFWKAEQLGVSSGLTLGCFSLGLMGMGSFLVLSSRERWNQPWELASILRPEKRARAALPTLASLILAMAWVLK
jgi:hypothetical protein